MSKKIDPSQHGFWERFLINIPFVLIVIFTIAFLGVGILLFFYSFVTIAAFKSAMIFLILFGGSLFAISIGLATILLFKKYHIYYEKKMDIFNPNELKTETHTTKTFKDYLTFSNITYCIMLLGAILCIVSALTGCTKRDKWLDAITPYIESNGYYADVKTIYLQINIDDDNDFSSDYSKIDIDFKDKTAVIIYNEDDDKKGQIIISSYMKFEKQIVVLNARNQGTLTLCDNLPPQIKQTPLNKLLFFIYNDNYFENQVKIFIPLEYKDTIKITEINGNEIIIAKIKETR